MATARNFTVALDRLLGREGPRKRYYGDLAKSMAEELSNARPPDKSTTPDKTSMPDKTASKVALDLFAAHVVNDNLPGHGRVHAACKLGYFRVSPFILLDGIFCPSGVLHLSEAAKNFAKPEVIEVVKFLAQNFDDVDAVVAKIR